MNDDLGNFPTPNTSTSQPSKSYTPPDFEPTPDEIPSPVSQSTTPDPIQNPDPSLSTSSATEDNFFPEIKSPEPEKITPPPSIDIQSTQPTPSSEPVMATTPPSTKSNSSSLVAIILLLVAGVGISGSVFLYSQSAVLKSQLTDITKTLEQQKSIVTPSPTPSIIDIPTPSPTLEVTEEAEISPTLTPSPTLAPQTDAMPIALAPQALKVAIKHEPNAQLILIKTENATNPEKLIIKYFFRNSLTNKKYFYVSINSKNESEINDNAIYVNPDNNIPSLNDLVLGNKLGVDFTGAYEIATKLCTTQDCKKWPVNAQFIKSGDKTIWQLSFDPAGEKFIIQIDSRTKVVLFKSENF